MTFAIPSAKLRILTDGTQARLQQQMLTHHGNEWLDVPMVIIDALPPRAEASNPTADAPGYWRNETSGVLIPAVEAYLNRQHMTSEQVAAMRAYFRQWLVKGAWAGGDEIKNLTRDISKITTQHDISGWLDRALLLNIDPL